MCRYHSWLQPVGGSWQSFASMNRRTTQLKMDRRVALLIWKGKSSLGNGLSPSRSRAHLRTPPGHATPSCRHASGDFPRRRKPLRDGERGRMDRQCQAAFLVPAGLPKRHRKRVILAEPFYQRAHRVDRNAERPRDRIAPFPRDCAGPRFVRVTSGLCLRP
jgi:hypothetical protein